MLFATKRSRSDTGTSISYLMKIVRHPDQSDWMKTLHLFKYVRGTKDLALVLSAYQSGMIKWYIYGSHAVHHNMRGNTGGRLIMGQGYPILAFRKQKLKTSSSTKSEIFGVDLLMPSVLCTRSFFRTSGLCSH